MDSDFKRVEDYCRRVLESAPFDELGQTMAEVCYVDHEDGRHFQRVFISPGIGAYQSQSTLPFIAIDGTYARNCFAMTLLAAIGRDSNDHCFLMC